LIRAHSHPYLHLDYNAVREAGLSSSEVERFIAAEVIKLPGIAHAISRSDLVEGNYVDSPPQRQIRRSFHFERSVSVHLVPDQYWFVHSTGEAATLVLSGLAAIHRSPWPYDTHVPIFFVGHNVKAQKIERRVAPTDIAPTISNYLGIKYPSGNIGNPVSEVTQ